MKCDRARVSRRDVLKVAGATMAAGCLPRMTFGEAAPAKLPPVRQITRGPKFHWFGYYDKLEFDPTGRYVLGMEVDFEGRSPTADDVVRVGMVDLEDGDRWIELGRSRSWCWQQGCMLQWRPGSKTEVLWNDRDGDKYVCHVLDVKSGKRRTLPAAVYAVSPCGKWAVTTDFRRLNDCRPGYGYPGIVDPNRDVAAPEDAGIWKVDLETGQQTLLLSYADLTKVPQPGGFSAGAKHWFNHLLVAPGGKRFTFLHRWKGEGERSWKTRMLTAGADGRDLYLLNSTGKVSHFIWRDPDHILAYAGHDDKGWDFVVMEDHTGKIEVIEGMQPRDGHCTYLPGDKWILCDTYPDRQRNQNPYLLNLATKQLYPLGHFLLPREYKGEWRCDLHPRHSPDGRSVVIDSPHGGQGRQLYVIDISGIVS